MSATKIKTTGSKTAQAFKEGVLADYKLANQSRQASLLGRKEVLTGKAKFGIFGDGKEVAQIAMAKAFKPGDFRSGYYRDQTFMFAIGELTIKQYFAQLYADTSLEREPASMGRQMNGHFATRSLDENGKWKAISQMKNSSADVSPTGSQMPRLVGLAYASKLYRQLEDLHSLTGFSNKGNEVAFGTIGNASAAEGMFFEAINAAGVLRIPMAVSVWDDGYGISVANEHQITKQNISEVLKGFAYDEKLHQGYHIYKVNGWDYEALVDTYQRSIALTRETHIPCLIHVEEMTQPQGHSTSGSHERYKSKERLQWEQDFDCIAQMRQWILKNGHADEATLDEIEQEAKKEVRKLQKEAYNEYISPIKSQIKEAAQLIGNLAGQSEKQAELQKIHAALNKTLDVYQKTALKAAHQALQLTISEQSSDRSALIDWYQKALEVGKETYNSFLTSRSDESIANTKAVAPVYGDDAKVVDGREILLAFFDKTFAKDPRVFAIGEDLGKIGGVNQGMAGLQEKYGELRITDTGIREVTILGQGIGAAMRGLKPIAEIQYLDYLLYVLQIISDDLASVQYRTAGGQKAPVIIRTRGHRFEGIWHAGSPMGAIVNSFRGVNVCVPRNMTQAAGFYNALLQSDEPGLIIERLNAYRSKEKMPDNIGEICLPLGHPEILQEGTDVTLVTYGACVGIAEEAVEKLSQVGISVELIDVQTLLPFDVNHQIVESLKKTNRIVFFDEDVPGGASAYMMQEVIEGQKGYFHLDSEPKTIAAKPHRPPYGSDGDYFTKPNAEDVFNTIYGLMHEFNPKKYPSFMP